MALITKNGDQAEKVLDAPKIEFPCENYVVKVVALDMDEIRQTLIECFKLHAPEIDPTSIKVNHSSKGRFVSFSFRILAQSEAQLSALHGDLMAIDAVKMVM